MIEYPNAKINLGLHILRKRTDGYHDIESILVPVPLTDKLVLNARTTARSSHLELSGIPVEGVLEGNLVLQAFRLLRNNHRLPEVSFRLEKHIPPGSGLGGGSSDAAFALRMLNDYFSLGLSGTELEHYAGQLGSDCPFFIRNTVAYVTGRGELIHPLDLDFTGQYILLYHPGIHISTADAYRRMQPDDSRPSLKELVSAPPDSWKKHLKNDFEEYVLASYPEMAQLKNHLYDAGAYYAALSGSGSALFGLFRQMPVEKYLLRPEFLACTRL